MIDAPATPRQLEYLRFIGPYLRKHGYSPSTREIVEHFNLSGPNAVQQALCSLIAKGYLTRDTKKARTLNLTRIGWRAINVESTDATPGPAHEPGPLCPRCGGTGRL